MGESSGRLRPGLQYSTDPDSQVTSSLQLREIITASDQVSSTSGDDADVDKSKVKESQNSSSESYQFQGF